MAYMNCQDVPSSWMTSLAGSVFKTEEDQMKIWKVAAFVCYNANTSPYIGNMCFDSNKLKIHPFGMATLKKVS